MKQPRRAHWKECVGLIDLALLTWGPCSLFKIHKNLKATGEDVTTTQVSSCLQCLVRAGRVEALDPMSTAHPTTYRIKAKELRVESPGKDQTEHGDTGEPKLLEETCARAEHTRNLLGQTRARCEPCSGSGRTSEGYQDHDGHGSFYVSAALCRRCDGTGRVDAARSAEKEAAAIQVEIKRLNARLKELKGGKKV